MKKNGGIDIKRVKDVNKTLLSKLLWRFGADRGNLWHQVIEEKYGLANC